jgi:hypothetical protein
VVHAADVADDRATAAGPAATSSHDDACTVADRGRAPRTATDTTDATTCTSDATTCTDSGDHAAADDGATGAAPPGDTAA